MSSIRELEERLRAFVVVGVGEVGRQGRNRADGVTRRSHHYVSTLPVLVGLAHG